MFIDTSGNITKYRCEDGFYISKLSDEEYTFQGDEIFYELDSNCVLLYDIFQNILFPDSDEYYLQKEKLPIWVYSAGHDSDFVIDKLQFEKYLSESNSEDINKHLYLADCQAMIMAMQDRVIYIKSAFIDFYRSLGSLKYFSVEMGPVSWISGYITARTFMNLYSVFISLYALFDLLTKIAFELENIRRVFIPYPKLSSSNILFGGKKRLKDIPVIESIFENSEHIRIVTNIRNELIHNGAWEQNPKVYLQFEDGQVTKRWILFPDTENGNIISSKNRKRFFAKGIKINEILPGLMVDVLDKVNNTIKNIIMTYSEEKK
jgi:hypothetical protein